MNAYDEAIWEVHAVLTKAEISYAIIGGAAVQYWGEPRFTQDIDLTVAAPLEDLGNFISSILPHFIPRIDDALDFGLKNRVILVQTSAGYPVDISLGLPGYEEQAINRSLKIELAVGKEVNICSAEDLIIHKSVAGRAQDIRDIESIIYRQGASLDVSYIRQWLAEFSAITGKSEIVDLFEEPWNIFLKNSSSDEL